MKRKITADLSSWAQSTERKPLILLGARQVGKTYTLKEFGRDHFQNVHHFDFEKEPQLASIFDPDLDPQRIISNLSVLKNITINPDRDLLILDEIQNCPRAITSLKYFHQDMRELAVCAAGSLLGLSLNAGSFPVGKVDILHLYPMDFLEFTNACNENLLSNLLDEISPETVVPDAVHAKAWELTKMYLIVGGLPEAVKRFISLKSDLNRAFNEARDVQNTLITGYIADMAKHSGKQNSLHIEQLWRNIPAQLGRDIDTGATKFIFKEAIPGLKGYVQYAGAIDWLVKANLVIRTPVVHSAALPFSAYTKENTFKLFLFDVGILGALAQLPPVSIFQYDYGTYKGYYAENFVAQEFSSANWQQLYSWKEKNSEVEFLKEVGGQIVPIEVKSGLSTKTKSLKIFLEKYKPLKAVILRGKPGLTTENRKIFSSHKTSVLHAPLYTASRLMQLVNKI